jgi:hypothetical protein
MQHINDHYVAHNDLVSLLYIATKKNRNAAPVFSSANLPSISSIELASVLLWRGACELQHYRSFFCSSGVLQIQNRQCISIKMKQVNRTWRAELGADADVLVGVGDEAVPSAYDSLLQASTHAALLLLAQSPVERAAAVHMTAS